MSHHRPPPTPTPPPAPPPAPPTLGSTAPLQAQAMARSNAAIAAGGYGFNKTYLSKGTTRKSGLKQSLGD